MVAPASLPAPNGFAPEQAPAAVSGLDSFRLDDQIQHIDRL